MKTLYITDLDGTLLNTKDRINPYSIETINRLVEQGMLFSYATARSLVSAAVVTRGLSAHIPVIAYNGCLIIHPDTHEILTSLNFSASERRNARMLIRQSGIFPIVYSRIDGRERLSWMPEHENDGIRRYLNNRKGDPRLRPVSLEEDLFAGDIFYFTCIGEKNSLSPIYDTIVSDDRYTCTLQQELYRPEYWCEIMPRQATKANAILKLKALWNCDRVVTFGDAVNDIPMFRVSDECYAVENAVDELKKLATGIIPRSDKDGVARWLSENAKFPGS